MGGDQVAPAGRLPDGIAVGDDGVARCWWGAGDPLYRRYHDTEWGRPVAEDRRLFEKLALEGFQAGLSWLTILRKREHFREVFSGFDPLGGRPVRRPGAGAPAGRPGHRPQPGQDRGDHQQRASLPRAGRGVRQPGGLRLAVRARPAVPPSAARPRHPPAARPGPSVGGDEQGPTTPRLVVCGSDHRVCLHGGHGPGE
jgi:Methyladenine glycosylase